MAYTTLTSVVGEGCGAEGAKLIDAACAAMGHVLGTAVAPKAIELDRLRSHLATADASELSGHLSPLLIVLGPSYPHARLVQLVDLIQRATLPAVVLVPTLTNADKRLERDGVFVRPWSLDAVALAGMLQALGDRQACVSGLAREVALHTRYEGGMRGEIDRIHDELNLAASVQREMLPRRMPTMGGVRFHAMFRPAGYVSGDIYDVVALDDRHVGFFIADAVGHGVPAALLTMVISRSLKMRSIGTLGDEIVWPGEAMTRLNDELCRCATESSPRFSTAVYGVIDTRTRLVRLVGAGHPPPLRVVREGSTSKLERVPTEGPLLGVFAGERFEETSFTLGAGETLLLYSDGFETAFDPPEASTVRARRGEEAYIDELRQLTWDAADHAAPLDELARRIDEQSGSLHQIDDVTAVTITALPLIEAGFGTDDEDLRRAA